MSRPLVLIPAYKPDQLSAAKDHRPTMAKVPTGSCLSRKRLFAGTRRHPGQPNKKPNFTTQANRKVNLNATRPRNEANINLTTNKKVNTTFKQKVDALASKKAEVAINKKAEVITRKAKAVVNNRTKAAPINRANTNVFSNVEAKIQSSPTQRVQFEVPETDHEATSSGESRSGTDDEEEAKVNPFTNMKPNVQSFRTRVANNEEIKTDDEEDSSSNEIESESESKSGGFSNKKVNAVMFPNVKVRPDSSQYPRIEKLDASSSESGSDVEVVSSSKVNAGNVSKANVQCTAQQSRGQEAESEDEDDSSSSGSGSDSGDDENGSNEEGSRKGFTEEVNSFGDSRIECLDPFSPTPGFAKVPENSLTTVVPTGKAQNSQNPAGIASSSPATPPFLKSPKNFLRQFNPKCNVRPNLGHVEHDTNTNPVGNFQNFQRVNANQPVTPTGNVHNFQKIDSNQPSFPTKNVENSETAEPDQIITLFQKSKPINPSEIPRWFPPKVKDILKCPACPDALAYKASQFSILIPSVLILNSPSTSSPITATGLDNCISIDGSDTVKPPTTNTS